MLYLWVKYIHVLSATILFGTGIGSAAVMLFAHFQKNIQARAVIYTYVAYFDCLFTGVSGFIQLFSGIYLVHLAGYSYKSTWIAGGLIGYSVTAICWFIVVYLQIALKNMSQAVNNSQILPARYYRFFMVWFILGWPAFISLLFVFYFMIFKPS